MSDSECRPKFETLPRIIADWLKPHLNLSNAAILDFGCGNAITACALALKNPESRVYAVDLIASNEMCLASGIRDYGIDNLPANLQILSMPANRLPDFPEKIDLIYSWSSFEHLSQDVFHSILEQMKNKLKPEGYLFTQISPLYYSPFGSHLGAYIKEPWAHLTMQQDLFLARLSEAAPDAASYPALLSLYHTLNRLTAKKLGAILADFSMTPTREYLTRHPDYSEESIRQLLARADAQTRLRMLDLFEVYDPEILLTEQLVYLYKNS